MTRIGQDVAMPEPAGTPTGGGGTMSGGEAVAAELTGLKERLEATDELVRLQAARIAELEGRLSALEKLPALRLVISGLIHEVNNMLTGALGFTYLLGRSPLTESPRENRMLATVNGELNRCATLTRSLLRYAQGSYRPRLEPLDLGEAVRTAAEPLTGELLEEEVVLQLELEPDPSPMLGVRADIQEVLHRLLANARAAIRARGGPGWIRVRLGREQNTLVLEVSDSGGGFREPERAFEPFYSTREADPEAGLGLVLVKSIIKEHGGRIQLGEGEAGAMFTMRFPGDPRIATSTSASDTTSRI